MDLRREIVSLNLSRNIEIGLLKLLKRIEESEGGGGEGLGKVVVLPKGVLTETDVDKWVMNKEGVAEIVTLGGGTQGGNGVFTLNFDKDLTLPEVAELTVELPVQPTNGGVTNFGGISVTWGTTVAIGATISDTRDNLVTWMQSNLVPNFVSSVGGVFPSVTNFNESVTIILDGITDDPKIQADYLNFVEDFTGELVVMAQIAYLGNIQSYEGDNILSIETNTNGTYNVTYSELINLNGVSYSSLNLHGKYYPITKNDWAKCLHEFLTSQISYVDVTVLDSVVTIGDNSNDELNVISLQGGDYGTSDIILTNTVVADPPTIDIVQYPVIGRLKEIDGINAIIDVSDINEIILPQNHSFVPFDVNNLFSHLNDYYLVWDGGEFISLQSLLVSLGANGAFILTIFKCTYIVKVLEEGNQGDRVIVDKFMLVPFS